MNIKRSGLILTISLAISACNGRHDDSGEKIPPPVKPIETPPSLPGAPTPAPTQTPIGRKVSKINVEIGAGLGLESRTSEHYSIDTVIGQVAPVYELQSENATYGMKAMVVEESR